MLLSSLLDEFVRERNDACMAPSSLITSCAAAAAIAAAANAA